ncbi:MAG TPA: hypothetical protein VMU14_00545 [Acidimicrobiales bacterium]|nr:hypothetical protein [Acidimicrobiales bacterium]
MLGATFSPGHGAPGATVRVTGLPLAVDCPDIRVWLSPEQDATSSITSPSDPRLVRLAGTVSHPRIGAGGIGDTRHGTLFTFVVPGLRAGTYATFSECIPASGGFGFSSGATPFTVDAATPDTDTIGANPGPATDPAGGAPGAATDRKAAHALLLAVGALASIGLAVRPRRRRRLPVS